MRALAVLLSVPQLGFHRFRSCLQEERRKKKEKKGDQDDECEAELHRCHDRPLPQSVPGREGVSNKCAPLNDSAGSTRTVMVLALRKGDSKRRREKKEGKRKMMKVLTLFFFWTCSTSFFTQLLLHIRGLSPSSLSLFSFWVGGFSVSRTRCVSLFPIPVVLKENGERKGGAREHKSNFLRSSACIKTAVVTTDTQTHTHARHEKNNKSALIGEARRRRHYLFLSDQRKKEKKNNNNNNWLLTFWANVSPFDIKQASKCKLFLSSTDI